MKTILILLSTAILAYAGPDAWLQNGLVTPETITTFFSPLYYFSSHPLFQPRLFFIPVILTMCDYDCWNTQ